MPRLPAVVEEPEGLVYQPDFVSPEEERAVVAAVEDMTFDEVRMHGEAAKRTVAHFGYVYGYDSWRLARADDLPESLLWLRDRAGAFADVDPDLFAETLVTRYPPGAGIGWHRDAPVFGPKVVGVSLLSSCSMRFQRRAGDVRKTYSLELIPRSAYVLSGAARSAWQHSIPAANDLRYSVTFRTLSRRAAVSGSTAR